MILGGVALFAGPIVEDLRADEAFGCFRNCQHLVHYGWWLRKTFWLSALLFQLSRKIIIILKPK